MTFLRFLGMALLLLGASAWGAPIFRDDFELGSVISPNGRWDSRTVATNNTVDESQSSRRRGTWGLLLSDRNGNSGGRTEGQLEKTVSTNPNNYYMRFWFRMSNRTANGGVYVSQLCSTSCNEGYGDILVRSDMAIELAAGTASGYQRETSSTQLSLGTWYLLEVAANNLRSSTNGRTRVWVNGALVAEMSGLDFGNRSVGLIVLGEPYADNGTFTGDLDFDDVVVDDAPLPSHFGVEGPANVATDTCVPVKVSLRDSVSNALAPAPYAVTGIPVALNGTASVSLYSDDGCTNATSSVSFNTDVNETTLYIKPTTTGSLTVTVGNSTTDFLPGERVFTVVQGTPPTSPNGTSCSLGSQCTSGNCVDGVCCNTACNAGACDACSVAQGALTDGSCRILPADTVCRPSADDCDAEEVCTGTSGVCPLDMNHPAGTVCRMALDVCDVEEQCTGQSSACPADALAPSALVCAGATRTHQASYCSGTNASCPEALPHAQGQPGLGGNGGILCATGDCIGSADLGCSCGSMGEAGAAAFLGALWMMRVAGRQRRRRRE